MSTISRRRLVVTAAMVVSSTTMAVRVRGPQFRDFATYANARQVIGDSTGQGPCAAPIPDEGEEQRRRSHQLFGQCLLYTVLLPATVECINNTVASAQGQIQQAAAAPVPQPVLLPLRAGGFAGNPIEYAVDSCEPAARRLTCALVNAYDVTVPARNLFTSGALQCDGADGADIEPGDIGQWRFLVTSQANEGRRELNLPEGTVAPADRLAPFTNDFRVYYAEGVKPLIGSAARPVRVAGAGNPPGNANPVIPPAAGRAPAAAIVNAGAGAGAAVGAGGVVPVGRRDHGDAERGDR